ncbi:MAG: hypothetical protein D6776_06585, partial [Planctomycetota bacterium]
EAKRDYDRYKEHFPYEDARALVMVQAPDLWTPTGLARVAALERDLRAIPGVHRVEGPLSVDDLVDGGDETVVTAPLIPRPDLPQSEIDARRRTATTDPLFRWQLTPPDGRSVTIRVTLEREVASVEARRSAFLHALRTVVARHRDGQRVVISGLPVIRSEYVEIIERDKNVTSGLALLVILLLLWITFRSWKEVLAALLTIGVSVLWSRGAMGILGYPEQILTSILPTVVMIISISDTVHILTYYKQALAEGKGRREALVEAMADSAWPCLLTEVTIAAGFLSLWFVDIRLISQFGVSTAVAMLLTWAANMTALPLAVWWLRPAAAEAARTTVAERGFRAFLHFVERAVTRRPGVVVGCAVLITGGAVYAASRMGMEYYAFDDLDPDSPVQREIRFAEATHGGCMALAVFIEPEQGAATGRAKARDGQQEADAEAAFDPDRAFEQLAEQASSTPDKPAYDPRVLALGAGIARWLEQHFPDKVKNAVCLADYVKKAHRIYAGEDVVRERGPLPWSASLVAQEMLNVGDHVLQDVVDFDRRTSAVFVPVPDVGTSRQEAMLAEVRRMLDREQERMRNEGMPVRLTATGMFAIGDDIYQTLVNGLLESLGGAIAVSLLVFSVVLGSWRLGLLALVPNVTPLALTFGMMGLLGIDLTPTTVIVFSITLVIADDDTVQYFARFKQRFLELARAGHPDPHREAALGTLHEAGLPMFITAVAVSAGFLMLLFSEFEGLRNFGLLIGVSLFAAVFADLFLTPILIMTLRPRIGGYGSRGAAADDPGLGAPEAQPPAGDLAS